MSKFRSVAHVPEFGLSGDVFLLALDKTTVDVVRQLVGDKLAYSVSYTNSRPLPQVGDYYDSVPDTVRDDIVNDWLQGVLMMADVTDALELIAQNVAELKTALPSQYILNQCCDGADGGEEAAEESAEGADTPPGGVEGVISETDLSACQASNLVYLVIKNIFSAGVASNVPVSSITPQLLAQYMAGGIAASLNLLSGVTVIASGGAVIVSGTVVIPASLMLVLAVGIKLSYLVLADFWVDALAKLTAEKNELVCAIYSGDNAYIYDNVFLDFIAQKYVNLLFYLVKRAITAIPAAVSSYGYTLLDLILDAEFVDCANCLPHTPSNWYKVDWLPVYHNGGVILLDIVSLDVPLYPYSFGETIDGNQYALVRRETVTGELYVHGEGIANGNHYWRRDFNARNEEVEFRRYDFSGFEAAFDGTIVDIPSDPASASARVVINVYNNGQPCFLRLDGETVA